MQRTKLFLFFLIISGTAGLSPVCSNAAVRYSDNIRAANHLLDASALAHRSGISIERMASLSREEFKKLMGGRLSLKEYFAFKILKRKAKNWIKHKAANEQPKVDGLGLASMILGIVGIILLPAVIFGALAFVFGIIALRRIKRMPEQRKGKGFAIAGLILGAIGTVGGIVFLATGGVQINFNF